MLKSLWKDECGAIVSTELVLVITILGIGMIVGLTTLRNAVVSELADTANAVNNVNQSYSYAGRTGHDSASAGSVFTDQTDYCDANDDAAGSDAQCVAVLAGTDEGTPVSGNGSP